MSGEFAAIGRLAALLAAAGAPPPGATWIGDDAAVVDAPPGRLLLAADAVVEGVHADLSLTGLDDLGWKAVAANLSDLAAMGAAPGHALVTVAGPPGTDLDALYRGIAQASAAHGIPVVGGDLVGAPVLVVTVAVTGGCDGRPVLRSGAAPGERIWVTGPLGAAAAGLRRLRAGGHVPDRLRAAHARPTPRLREGRAARLAGATAMIDVSDGIAADLGHLADASGVGFALDELPVDEGATAEEAASGGEDYELVFTAPPGADVAGSFAGLRAPIQIGAVVADPGTRTLSGEALAPSGWQHRWGS